MSDFNYVVARRCPKTQRLSCYVYGSALQFGDKEASELFLKYVRGQPCSKVWSGWSDWAIYPVDVGDA